MNIAYLSNSSEIGGGERCMESLFQGLRGSGINPVVICPGPGPFVDLLRGMGIEPVLRELTAPSLRNLARFLADFLWLSRFLKKRDIRLIHANSTMGGRRATLAARAVGIPLVCHVHYPLPLDFYRWVYKRLPKPGRLVFVCDDLQRQLGGVLAESYPGLAQEVVYNGIDTGFYAPKDVENKRPRIGIIANLQAVKGHEDFLEMAALLTGSGVDASFEIIGGDVQKQGRQAVLEGLAEKLGVRARVHFRGFVDSVVALLQDLDMVVVASHEEASPRCIIEAMSCRKPIVATRINGIPDVLEDGVNGLLVPAHSPKDLFQAVRRLIDDPGLRRKLAYAACRKVNENYSLEVYTRNVIGIYRKELGEALPEPGPAIRAR